MSRLYRFQLCVSVKCISRTSVIVLTGRNWMISSGCWTSVDPQTGPNWIISCSPSSSFPQRGILHFCILDTQHILIEIWKLLQDHVKRAEGIKQVGRHLKCHSFDANSTYDNAGHIPTNFMKTRNSECQYPSICTHFYEIMILETPSLSFCFFESAMRSKIIL